MNQTQTTSIFHSPIRALAALAVAASLYAVPATVAAPAEKERPVERMRGGERGNVLVRIKRAIAAAELSEEKQEEITKILDGAQTDLRALQPTWKAMERDERRQAMRKFGADLREEVDGILSEEEQASLRQAMRAAGQRGPERNRTERPATRPADLGGRGGRMLQALETNLTKLELDEEQQAKLTNAMDGLKADLRKIAEEADGYREAIREQAGTLLRELRKTIQETLTEEQRTTLRQEMRKGMRERAQQEGDRPRRERNRPRQRPADAEKPQTPQVPEAGSSRFLDRLEDGAPQTFPAEAVAMTAAGREVVVSTLLAEHRPTLVVAGTIQSPTFAARVADLPWLVDNVRDRGQRQADLLFVAQDEPTAAALRSAVGKRPGVTVLQADEARTVFAGSANATGDPAALVMPDGRIVFHQTWFDPSAVPGVLTQRASVE